MTRAKDPSAVDCVLIVDDVDSNVQHLELILRMAGASSVHTVTDARSAVDRCLEVLPDVVLMDLDMPHVDGHEVLDLAAPGPARRGVSPGARADGRHHDPGA